MGRFSTYMMIKETILKLKKCQVSTVRVLPPVYILKTVTCHEEEQWHVKHVNPLVPYVHKPCMGKYHEHYGKCLRYRNRIIAHNVIILFPEKLFYTFHRSITNNRLNCVFYLGHIIVLFPITTF